MNLIEFFTFEYYIIFLIIRLNFCRFGGSGRALVFELDFSVLDGCHEVLKISAFLYVNLSDLLPDGPVPYL